MKTKTGLQSGRLTLTVLFVALSTWVLPVQAIGNDSWRFQVLLDGKPIGEHSFTVRGNGQQLQATNEARFAVKFLGFTAYTYQHNNTERWQNHCLTQMNAQTNDNGQALTVQAAPQVAQGRTVVEVKTNEAAQNVAGCLKSFAYWHLPYLKTPRLLNSQTGEVMQVQLQKVGNESLEIDGQTTPAQRYRLRGKDLQIDLWYSTTNRWIGLESLTKEGRRIRYVLQGGAS